LDRILVVDDESDILNLTRMILEGDGYAVSLASTGEEALKLVGSDLPDLVLLDLVMPGKSGLEVCKILKTQPKTSTIPIVIFTVLSRDVDRKLTSEAGADAHLTKPFTPAVLLAEVKKRIRLSRGCRFSKQIGIDHKRLLGKKILLEFDPRTDYEMLVRDFAFECTFHRERVIVITQKGSAVDQVLRGEDKVKLFDLNPAIRFSPILKENSQGPLTIILDSLTDLALSERTEEEAYMNTYKFAQNSLQVLAEPRITALFLLNPSAHDPRDVASLRGLFSNQLSYEEHGLVISRFTG